VGVHACDLTAMLLLLRTLELGTQTSALPSAVALRGRSSEGTSQQSDAGVCWGTWASQTWRGSETDSLTKIVYYC
jgi:hypothetical protein